MNGNTWGAAMPDLYANDLQDVVQALYIRFGHHQRNRPHGLGSVMLTAPDTPEGLDEVANGILDITERKPKLRRAAVVEQCFLGRMRMPDGKVSHCVVADHGYREMVFHVSPELSKVLSLLENEEQSGASIEEAKEEA